MNKIILGLLLLIPVLLIGISAVSASPDDGGAKISTVEHTADIHSDGGDSVKLPYLLNSKVKSYPSLHDSIGFPTVDSKDNTLG